MQKSTENGTNAEVVTSGRALPSVQHITVFSYVFGIDMDENGGLHECIGCPYRTCPDCEKDCKIYKRYQKRLARMEEDKEQERYLQEYAKRKQEKKNRKEGKR